MHVMESPSDAHVYHYSFNCSRLDDVVRMLFTTQQRLYSYQLSKALP